MNKTFRKIIRILLLLMAVLAGLLVITTAWNALSARSERKSNPPPGVMVSVNESQMHVYSAGSGEKQIVLLSGFGNNCPVLDFKDLAEGLSRDHTVIVVEYFGYGWSGTTDAPRTVSNIVEETRQALKLAGFAPPYVLMPHSASGIYTLYYANTHPEEIEAIIGLETSTPAQIPVFEKLVSVHGSIYSPGTQGSLLWKFLRFSGLRRLAVKLAPGRYTPIWMDFHSQADMDLLDSMYLWNYGNPNLIDEADRFLENMQAVRDMTIPADIPAAFLLADNVVKINRDANNLDWIKMHEDLLPGNVYGKVIVLEGDHYIYYDHVEDIRQVLADMLNSD